MRPSVLGLFSCLAGLWGCGASGKPAVLPAEAPSQQAVAAVKRAEVDYVAVGSYALLDAIEPLLAHRERQGHRIERIYLENLPRPEPMLAAAFVRDAIGAVAKRSGKTLRYVLLVGDAPAEYEDLANPREVPTFYRPKVEYRKRPTRDLPEDLTNEPILRAPSDDPPLDGSGGFRFGRRSYGLDQYPTDLPYAYAHHNVREDLTPESAPALAVGRLPARRPEEVAAFARKVIRYETAQSPARWRKSVTVFSGPANFGAFADYIVESTVKTTLDDEVPYDWDVDIVFPKLGSPYAYPFPKIASHFVSRLEEGALIAGYVGHGSPYFFDYIFFRHGFYDTGSIMEAKRLDIREGNPFFISLTCENGHFDLPNGRVSIAEALVLNADGAIATFASSRDSHPYTNGLYGKAIVKTFLDERPVSIGEGLVKVKQRMKESEIAFAPLLFDSDPTELANEHEGLYNLFGDPATRLRYPAQAKLSLASQEPHYKPGAELAFTVEVDAIKNGTAQITLETKRSTVRAHVFSKQALQNFDTEDIYTIMEKTWTAANNKLIHAQEAPVVDHQASVRIALPSEPGEYAIKAFITGNGEAATASARILVKGPETAKAAATRP